jgi:hypothetical protein
MMSLYSENITEERRHQIHGGESPKYRTASF